MITGKVTKLERIDGKRIVTITVEHPAHPGYTLYADTLHVETDEYALDDLVGIKLQVLHMPTATGTPINPVLARSEPDMPF